VQKNAVGESTENSTLKAPQGNVLMFML
jgi:hypothetical protein